MDIVLLYFVVSLALAGLCMLAWRILKVYLRYRGKGVVICPDTLMPVAVEVDAKHLAWSAAGGTFDLRLKDCSRWPEHANCGQQCARQVEAAPELCLTSAIQSNWYEGKTCVLCHQPFQRINPKAYKHALLNLGGQTVAWDEIPSAKLYDALTTHLPVCRNCRLVETSYGKNTEQAKEFHRETGIHV